MAGKPWPKDDPRREAMRESMRGNTRGVAHGLARTPSYNSWKKMMSRCYKPEDKYFKNYGGRGISVCERWHDVTNFIADMGQRVAGLSLERMDVNGNYEPRNCCWIPLGMQAKNRTAWKHTPEGLERIREARRREAMK